MKKFTKCCLNGCEINEMLNLVERMKRWRKIEQIGHERADGQRKERWNFQWNTKR